MRGVNNMFDKGMKGDVALLVSIVDSYIAELESSIDIQMIGVAIAGTMSVENKVRLELTKSRLDYIKYQKDRAIYIDADVDVELA